MNTYDVSHESTSMYMEQNAEPKILGLHSAGRHATRPLACVPLGTIKQKTLGLRTTGHHETKNRWDVYYLALWNERPLGYVPLGTMQQDNWAAYPLTLWNERTLGCVPLGNMKRKTVGLRTPRHQNEMKTNDEYA